MSTPADQRNLLLLICAVLAIMLNGCASTTIRNSAGVAVLHTQANMRNVAFRSGDTSFTADVVDHATATRAGGSLIGTAGAAAAGVITSTFVPAGL